MAIQETSVFALLKETIETVWGMKYDNAFAKNIWQKYMDVKKADDFWVDGFFFHIPILPHPCLAAGEAPRESLVGGAQRPHHVGAHPGGGRVCLVPD